MTISQKILGSNGMISLSMFRFVYIIGPINHKHIDALMEEIKIKTFCSFLND
jgi:hypothetical protein